MKRIAILLVAVMAVFMASAADKPQYPGGEAAMKAFIDKNLSYPQRAKDLGIEGTVNLQVTIKADGSVGPIKVVRMIDPDLEGEAMRIVGKMPKWTPADKEGTPVDAVVPVAVTFILPE